MKSEEIDHLIHLCLEDCMSESEALRLSEQLEHSAEARERYWSTASVHGLLEHTLQHASIRAVNGQTLREQPPSARWFHWQSWGYAAAGIVFGVFGAAMVFAYGLPMGDRSMHRTVATFTEGFESAEMSPLPGFPRESDVWSGDLPARVMAESGVIPIEGSHMLRLEQRSPGLRKFSYAWRILDMDQLPAPAEAETLHVEISAAFHAPGEARPLHYQIRLAAFSQEPSELRQIWNHESVLFDTVLQHACRNRHVAAGEPGWQVVEASMEIPRGTRSLLVSLAASEAHSVGTTGQYFLDDVRVRFVHSPTYKK